MNTLSLTAQTVNKQLYLSSGQMLDRIDPIATGDLTTEQSSPLGSQITQVGVPSSSNAAQTATTHTFSYNSGNTGIDRVLMVGISYRNLNNRAVSSVTYGGQSMTLVGDLSYVVSSTYYARVYIYRIVNPAQGSNSLSVTWNGALSNGAVVGAVTYSGVNQAGPTGVFSSASGNNATPSVTVSGASDRLMFGVVSGRTTSIYSTTTVGGTQLWSAIPYSGLTAGSGQTAPGAASVALTWSGSSSRWAAAGVSIIPATTDTVSFTQSPALCSNLIIKSGTITVTNYISVLRGSMPANPNITAILKYGANNIITLSNPTYNSVTRLLSWTGNLGADINIPSGESISLHITTNQPNVVYRIDYDSQNKPSKIDFPTSTYINISNLDIHTDSYPDDSPTSQVVTNVPDRKSVV